MVGQRITDLFQLKTHIFNKGVFKWHLPLNNKLNLDYDNASRAVDRRMEAVRLARDILMENDRNKPTGERGIAASDVTAFADTLLTYVTQ
jgi:hypothetical protein